MNRSFAILAIVAVQLLITGCTAAHRIAVQGPTPPGAPAEIVGVTTTAGVEVTFDNPASVQGDKLTAKVKHKPWQVSLAEVQRYWIETRSFSAGRTIGLVAGTAAVIALVAAVELNHKSTPITPTCSGCSCCLFVYSWDGGRYDFDTEAYTGAITRGLERDDYSLLTKVRAQDGEYRFLLSNDNDETQYTDQLELWVVDQDRGVLPRAAADGSLHSVREPVAPLSARDAHGNDLMDRLAKRDSLIWEPPPAEQRQELVAAFPKPADASHAKLLVSATETAWAGDAAARMLALLGPELTTWYKQIDDSPELCAEFQTWMAREEMFALKIEVEEPTGWQVRGMMPISGPYVSDERVVSLDISHVVGDQVHVRMRPPAGFWAFNSIAMDYTTDLPAHVTKLEPMRASDAAGRDLLPLLRTADHQYHEMHEVGEKATVAFKALPAAPGMDRTLFLHTRGYYRMHIPENSHPDLALFQKLRTEPEAGAAYSAKLYAEMKK